MKCVDPNIEDKDCTFAIIEQGFIEKFIPTNRTSCACHTLADMQMKGEPFKSDFHKFKSVFELKVACSGVKNEFILMNMLGKVVNANLAFKMMALLEEPKDHKKWPRKASQFYDVVLRMKKPQRNKHLLYSVNIPLNS